MYTVYVQETTWCKSSLTLSPYSMFSNMWRLLWMMACSTSWLWSAHWLIWARLDKTLGSIFWCRCGRLRNWRSARLTCSSTWTLTRGDTSQFKGSQVFWCLLSPEGQHKLVIWGAICGSNTLIYCLSEIAASHFSSLIFFDLWAVLEHHGEVVSWHEWS